MGDRGNIVMDYSEETDDQDQDRRIFFYTHWSGSELKSIVQTALRKRWRWDDPSYLSKIIFWELVKGNEERETGYGIAPHEIDNEHPYVIVTPSQQIVTEGETIWTFEEFIQQEFA